MRTVKTLFGGVVRFIRQEPKTPGSDPPRKAAEPLAKEPARDTPDLVTAELDALFQHGLNTARDSDEVSQNPLRRSILHGYAAGRITGLYKGPFDAINNPEDAAIQEAIETAKARERKLENDLIRATAARNEAQRNVPADQPPPRVSVPVVGAAIIGFALAFGSALSELPPLKAIEDDQLALIISFLIGGALGCLCVFAMFGLKVHDPKASPAWSAKPDNPAWQIIAGLVMIAAFGLIRAYASTGPRDWYITLALMGIDTSVLMYAKGEAVRHRQREDVWAHRSDGLHQKLLLATVNETQCAAIETDLERAKAERRAADGKLEARLRFNFDLEAMTQAAISAIDEGYFQGVDFNNGRYTAGKGSQHEHENVGFDWSGVNGRHLVSDFRAGYGDAERGAARPSSNGHR